jgi:hypothetical protein
MTVSSVAFAPRQCPPHSITMLSGCIRGKNIQMTTYREGRSCRRDCRTGTKHGSGHHSRSFQSSRSPGRTGRYRNICDSGPTRCPSEGCAASHGRPRSRPRRALGESEWSRWRCTMDGSGIPWSLPHPRLNHHGCGRGCRSGANPSGKLRVEMQPRRFQERGRSTTSKASSQACWC